MKKYAILSVVRFITIAMLGGCNMPVPVADSSSSEIVESKGQDISFTAEGYIESMICSYYNFNFMGNEAIALNLSLPGYKETPSNMLNGGSFIAKIEMPEEQLNAFIMRELDVCAERISEYDKIGEFGMMYDESGFVDINENLFDYACLNFSTASKYATVSRQHEVVVLKPKDGAVVVYIRVGFISWQ